MFEPSSHHSAISAEELTGPRLRADVAASPNKVPQLLLVTAILLVVFLWLVSRDPLVEARLYALAHARRPQPKPDISALLKADPHVGSRPFGKSALRLVDTALPKQTSARLVIHVGECSGCLPGDLKQWVSDARNLGLAPILVSTAPLRYARSFAKDRGIRGIPVVSDPDREVLASLNPVFAPRAYLLSRDGRLQWLQTDPELCHRTLDSDPALVEVLRERRL
jgi:hypothetical protein